MKTINTPESVLDYYYSNRPVSSRPTIDIWRPTLLQMIRDGLPANAAHAWMVANKEQIKLPIPAATTVRDWMSELRPSKKERIKLSNELISTDSSHIVTAPILSETGSDCKHDSPVTKFFPEEARVGDEGYPDLYDFPVAVIPEGAAYLSEEEFREALMPAFLERNEHMQQIRSYYQSLSATQRSKLADAAFDRLDSGNEHAYISHYADIYVITRDSNATLTTWTQGILRGMRALKEVKLVDQS